VIGLRRTTDVGIDPSEHDPAMFNGTRVAAAMTTGVISCPPDTPLAEVAELMADRRVHAVYVFDDDAGELWGLVSDLDLVAAARGDLAHLTARDASVTPLVAVQADDSLDRAAQLLAENGVSHLAVLDAGAHPVGVLSTLDLAQVIAGHRSKITSTASCS
jgi:CBS domain-containing protein